MKVFEKILRALLADRLKHTSNLDAGALAEFQGLQAELAAFDADDLAEESEAAEPTSDPTGSAQTKEEEVHEG